MAGLKNSGADLLHILGDPFNTCWNESCFPDYWKISSLASVFTNAGKRSVAKRKLSVSLLSVVSKIFEKILTRGAC